MKVRDRDNQHFEILTKRCKWEAIEEAADEDWPKNKMGTR